MDPLTLLIIICWLVLALLFSPILFFVCIYLPELPVRYIKRIRAS
ncbi:PREDICTED: uncharacterized protein LOC108971841 isoform X2 [Bactrocera latifrons]|nr:PREDICTED: uncharacterized protein LOC108971841 isoform X2 [Bactrocera latifrons]